MSSQAGPVAVVTGGSGGIGSAICRQLAREGARVVVNYGHNADAAASVVGDIEAAGGRAIATQADVSRAGDVERLFDESINAFGAINIVVANAGLGAGTTVAEMSDDEFDRVFALNARGTFMILRAAANRIEDHGRIINISSGLTRRPTPGIAAYAGSKAATELFGRVLAEEVGSRSITVNSVLPGATLPGMFENMPPEDQERYKQASYFNRLGDAEDVAAVVGFLASSAARWISGQRISADGGALTP